MTVYILKSDFTRGALHPLAHARQEKEWYQQSVQSLENFLIVKYGGIRRRSGTRFCGVPKYADKKATFIPFEFNSTQVYFIELGHLYFRIWTSNGSLVLNSGVPVEVTTPYTEAEVFDVQIEQSGDTIFLAHTSHPPARIVRLSNTNWTYGAVDFQDGPFGPLNDTSVTVTPSATASAGASVTLTWSSASAVNGGAGFGSGDVGRHVRIQVDGKYGWGKITAVTNTVTVSVTMQESEISTNAATGTWQLGVICPRNGYFGCVTFYQGRLCWARTIAQPRIIAFSHANLPFRYTPSKLTDGTVTDDHGFIVELLSGKADGILWLQENVNLQIGQASAIRTLGQQDSSTPFGPRNFRERLEIGMGTSKVVPVLSGTSTIHTSRFGMTLRDLFYDYQVDSLVAPEISTLSQHLLVSGIEQLAFCEEPSNTIWARLATGSLVATTYERYDKVIGLHHHTLLGGFVEAIAAAPNTSKRYDALMMIVRRVVDDETVRYVEILEPEFVNKPQDDAWFVDSGLRYEGSPVNIITGLKHLIGETVSIFADGAVLPNQVVEDDGAGDGMLELPNGQVAEKVLVGIPMQSRAQFLRTTIQARNGLQLGLPNRVPFIVLDLFETSGLKLGNDQKWETVQFRKPLDPMNKSPSLYTGTVRVVAPEGGWSTEGQYELLCDSVLPATVRAVNFGVQDSA